MRVTVDGIEQFEKAFPLVDDRKEHSVEARIPRMLGDLFSSVSKVPQKGVNLLCSYSEW
jgi:hypothetical protein